MLKRVASSLVVLFAVAFLSLTSTQVSAQFVVDCSGGTPGAYTTINSVIPLLTNGSVVRITGTCTENVTIKGLNNLHIGAPVGQSANLQGNLNINGVQNLFLYGLNVTNPSGQGIGIGASLNVTLDDCTSSNNGGGGLNVTDSIVNIQNTAAFNNNGGGGISVSGMSDLEIGGGPASISNNVGDGIYLNDGKVGLGGNLVITNNKLAQASGVEFIHGHGIVLQGHSRALVVCGSGSNIISGNQAGGILVQESSQLSLTGPTASPYTNIVDGNGAIGISVGLGSQLELDNHTQITNHPDAGIDIYTRSGTYIVYGVQITNNGTGPSSTYPMHAGVRIDGNSEAYISGSQITQNGGPGILALVNSSVELSGDTLTSNAAGPIQCDSSSWMVTDQQSFPMPMQFGFAVPCAVPNNNYGPRPHANLPEPVFDNTQFLADEANYQKLISSF